MFTCIRYDYLFNMALYLKLIKLNSWLGLSVALFHSSTVCCFYPLILLSDDGKLVRGIPLICWHASCTKGIEVV